MSSVDTHWQMEGRRRPCYKLYVGVHLTPVATITRSIKGKHWGHFIELPGHAPVKTWLPLDDALEDVERVVHQWFDICNTSRPAMESTTND